MTSVDFWRGLVCIGNKVSSFLCLIVLIVQSVVQHFCSKVVLVCDCKGNTSGTLAAVDESASTTVAWSLRISPQRIKWHHAVTIQLQWPLCSSHTNNCHTSFNLQTQSRKVLSIWSDLLKGRRNVRCGQSSAQKTPPPAPSHAAGGHFLLKRLKLMETWL